jgi:hypothetical protein
VAIIGTLLLATTATARSAVSRTAATTALCFGLATLGDGTNYQRYCFLCGSDCSADLLGTGRGMPLLVNQQCHVSLAKAGVARVKSSRLE